MTEEEIRQTLFHEYVEAKLGKNTVDALHSPGVSDMLVKAYTAQYRNRLQRTYGKGNFVSDAYIENEMLQDLGGIWYQNMMSGVIISVRHLMDNEAEFEKQLYAWEEKKNSLGTATAS